MALVDTHPWNEKKKIAEKYPSQYSYSVEISLAVKCLPENVIKTVCMCMSKPHGGIIHSIIMKNLFSI